MLTEGQASLYILGDLLFSGAKIDEKVVEELRIINQDKLHPGSSMTDYASLRFSLNFWRHRLVISILDGFLKIMPRNRILNYLHLRSSLCITDEAIRFLMTRNYSPQRLVDPILQRLRRVHSDRIRLAIQEATKFRMPHLVAILTALDRLILLMPPDTF